MRISGAELSARIEPRSDTGAALPLTVAVALVLASVSLALVAHVTQRTKDLVYEERRTRSLHAAEGGLDAALALIRRASTSGEGGRKGIASLLPCETEATGADLADLGSGGFGYRAVVSYYRDDPRHRSAQWRVSERLPCVEGSGPSTQPLYALITSVSTGAGSAGTFASFQQRSVEVTYRLGLSFARVLGGAVATSGPDDAPSLDRPICWSVTELPAAPGAAVLASPCIDGDPSQQFAYNPDFSFTYAGTNLCLTAAYDVADPAARLEPCAISGAERYRQAWTYNEDDRIQATKSDGSGRAPFCLAPEQGGAVSSRLILSNRCDLRWTPASEAGVGGAGWRQQQFVNFAQSGRCIDVTRADRSLHVLHAHACKQDATAPLDWWPQQFSVDPKSMQIFSGRFLGTDSPIPYCLTSQGRPNGAVSVEPCTTTSDTKADAGQRWVVNRDAAVQQRSFTIVDDMGYCISISTWGQIVTETCDGSNVQKWNAPVGYVAAAVEGFLEH